MLTKKKDAYETPAMNRGSIIITLVVTMLVFSVLIAAMYSLTSSSIFGQLNTSSITKATYLAKSGYNYLASQYKSASGEVAKNLKLEDLHAKTFQLQNNDGSFYLDVSPYYFRVLTTTDTDLRSGDYVNFKFPGGATYNFTVGQTGTMAVYTSAGYGWFNYTITAVAANNYTLRLTTRPRNERDSGNRTTGVSPGTSMVPVRTTSSAQTLTYNGSLTVTGAGNIYPARFGFFEIPYATGATGVTLANRVFIYDSRSVDTFSGIRDASTPTTSFSSASIPSGTRIYAHAAAQINSTGTFDPGLGPVVSNTFSRMAILGYKPGGNSNNVSDVITGVDNWVAIGTGVGIDTTNQQIQLGQSTGNTAGVTWYAGNADAANCATGLCDFGLGIRAYFVFQDSTGSGSSGDGFMFMLMNGTLNDTTKRGGTPSGSGMGELMGYSGPGNSTDGLGLQPPKISVEFDRYNNAGLGGTPAGAGCGNGRNDATGNHMALMFWGNNTGGTCSGGINDGLLAASFDDNIHNAGTAGSATVPINSYSGTPSPACATDPTQAVCGYSAQTFSNTNARPVRIEITRAATPNGSGNYEYNIQVWIWTTTCTGAGCDDVTLPYTASTAQINRTIELDPTLHANYNKMFFGFTQGTGAATQNILISNFDIYFPTY